MVDTATAFATPTPGFTIAAGIAAAVFDTPAATSAVVAAAGRAVGSGFAAAPAPAACVALSLPLPFLFPPFLPSFLLILEERSEFLLHFSLPNLDNSRYSIVQCTKVDFAHLKSKISGPAL